MANWVWVRIWANATDFNHSEKVIGEMLLIWGCFGLFGALIRASGVTNVRRGLPERG